MKIVRIALPCIFLILLSFLILTAHPNFTGYSGAPGCKGTCASSCHGFAGGTISVSGFPSTYTPGQIYTLKVSHSAGGSIANFNASVRIVTDSSNAGVLSAGQSTVSYKTTGETNGMHFSNADQDSGTFSWTAPDTSVGEVRLYLAGHQGTTPDDPNTELVLSATSGVCLAKAGDVTGDGTILLPDIIAIINFLFRAGPTPTPLCRGDANGNGTILLTDVIYLINFLFRAGPSPVKTGVCCL